MKLSCGKCGAIQSFSGEPLKCDVCGWLVESTDTAYWQNLRLKRAQPLHKSKTVVELQQIFQMIVGLAIVLVIMYLFFSWLTPIQDDLADKYKVSKTDVTVEPKPHGCDFEDAPLGNKHCHYEKVVDTDKACPAPDCRITKVYVSWRKVEE